MNVIDVVFLASMGAVVVFFAGVAVLEWWDTRARHSRTSQRPEARLFQHPRSDHRIFPAA